LILRGTAYKPIECTETNILISNILEPNKKNIAGVNEFVDNHDTPKHLIIGIGNTDISSRPLSECMADMTVLLPKTYKPSKLHSLLTFWFRKDWKRNFKPKCFEDEHCYQEIL
jgi:hypothetical protein